MKLSEESLMQKIIDTLPQKGTVTWIGVRPARKAEMIELQEVNAAAGKGLEGDRFSGNPESKRQVTLIQAEHLWAIASFLGKEEISPKLLRRNIVVKGINLSALKDKQFWLGEVLLEMTGECHPCSRMEENLGEGGYNAARGHGGITARILQSGLIRIGDIVGI